MGWQDLLQVEDETIVLPWVGSKLLSASHRQWLLEGKLPPEHGWHKFRLKPRTAVWSALADPQPEVFKTRVQGYLVGDMLIPDGVEVYLDPAKLILCSTRLHCIEPGLDRFARVVAGRVTDTGPYVFESLGMPLGPEDDVLQAFLDHVPSVERVRGVPPALDVAFRFETWRRDQAEKRRVEAERLRKEEDERFQREQQRQQLVEQLGDARGRRQMAQVDFGEAAKAALIVGGATYLDHRESYNKGEIVVRFRYLRRRFECTCDRNLRIIDAGVCLTDHDTGEKGDTYFTLESLPGVIREADTLGKLVVFRHVD